MPLAIVPGSANQLPLRQLTTPSFALPNSRLVLEQPFLKSFSIFSSGCIESIHNWEKFFTGGGNLLKEGRFNFQSYRRGVLNEAYSPLHVLYRIGSLALFLQRDTAD